MHEPIVLGKYLLLDRIAIGGMAEVFAATPRDGPPGRLVAVKRILPTLAEDGEFLTMFLDEARIAVQLHHPGIVAIHELGQHGDAYFIAMDYVPGTTLRGLLARLRAAGERLPIPLAAAVAWRVADALDYAHRKHDALGLPLHVVHRDVSPANVLLGFDGSVRLIDFGIAQAAFRTRREEEVLRGKFGYMSPEQVRGAPVDRRADVFALGAVLHEMLTGAKLFTGPSELAVLEQVRAAEVPPPSAANPAVPPVLDALVLRALAPDPEKRTPWASELRDTLAPFVLPGTGRGDPPALARFLAGWCRDELRAELDRAERLRGPRPPWRPSGQEEATERVQVPGPRAQGPEVAPAPAAKAALAARAAALADPAPPLRPATRRRRARRAGRQAALAAAVFVAAVVATSFVLAGARSPGEARAMSAVSGPAPGAAGAATPVGRLAIQPAEAARVLVDGVPLVPRLGAGEIRVVAVPPGRHRVELVAGDGRRGGATVEVQAGETSELLRVELR
jgi:serine/threonine-protein kinase